MENIWHLRRVADNASKACWICYKPTTSVLITPNNKVRQNTPSISMELTYLQDFFYACPGHLVDRGFCQPDADEAAAVEAKNKKEYEEKQKLKREKRKSKDKEKDKAKEKEAKSKDEEEDKQDEKAKDDKVYDEEQTYSRP
jgi:flagellar biosynthesis GTPase FlhF